MHIITLQSDHIQYDRDSFSAMVDWLHEKCETNGAEQIKRRYGAGIAYSSWGFMTSPCTLTDGEPYVVAEFEIMDPNIALQFLLTFSGTPRWDFEHVREWNDPSARPG